METTFTFINTPYASTAANSKLAYNKAYKAWCQNMITNHHCTISIKEIAKRLHVSSYWIATRLFPNVEYVKITPKVLEELGMDSKSPLLFNEIELRAFLKRAAVFSRQTIVIDLLKCKAARKVALAIENNDAISKWDDNNRHAYGKRSNRLLELLDDEYENVNETARSNYEPVLIKPFDFWDKDLVISNDYPNRETAYRDIFRKGMVKINIFGKAVFTSLENLDSIAYPLTIQYIGEDKRG